MVGMLHVMKRMPVRFDYSSTDSRDRSRNRCVRTGVWADCVGLIRTSRSVGSFQPHAQHPIHCHTVCARSRTTASGFAASTASRDGGTFSFRTESFGSI